jgi:hypothetical protein
MSERDTALSQALAAYTGVTSGEALDTARVRSRILQSVRAPRRRSLRRLSFVLPLVAVLAASAAFAASQPALRAAVRASFGALLGDATAPSHTRLPQGPRHAAEPAASAPASTPAASVNAESALQAQAPIAIDALPLAVPASSSPGAAPPGAGRPAVEALAVTPAPDTPNEGDAQLNAYRSAHRAHFDGGSAAASLAAWDRYLADFPAGSFADDARFNRALCLIRLGRITEARRALEPFAGAPPGSYRRAEATSLLAGLDSAQP